MSRCTHWTVRLVRCWCLQIDRWNSGIVVMLKANLTSCCEALLPSLSHTCVNLASNLHFACRYSMFYWGICSILAVLVSRILLTLKWFGRALSIKLRFPFFSCCFACQCSGITPWITSCCWCLAHHSSWSLTTFQIVCESLSFRLSSLYRSYVLLTVLAITPRLLNGCVDAHIRSMITL